MIGSVGEKERARLEGTKTERRKKRVGKDRSVESGEPRRRGDRRNTHLFFFFFLPRVENAKGKETCRDRGETGRGRAGRRRRGCQGRSETTRRVHGVEEEDRRQKGEEERAAVAVATAALPPHH